ncbi:MAG: hypothetical protein ASARMPREDX12_004196 [Alectoria sarmentosa]|nr:MAG: hypothetical protein ASARMPREDX12_004196 [Alectoria sarmentosa]
MAPKRIDPRSTIKKIVKAHSSRSLSKNADVLIFLDYNLFVQDLMQSAWMHAKKGNRRRITADRIREATVKSLTRLKC